MSFVYLLPFQLNSLFSPHIPLTPQIIFFLQALNLYRPCVDGLLELIGEENWSLKTQRSVLGRQSMNEGRLSHFIGDALTTLLHALETRARSVVSGRKQTILASVYMLNNVSTMINRIQSGPLLELLSEDAVEYLEKQLNRWQGDYLDQWKPAVEPLMDVTYVRAGTLTTKLGNVSERQQIKERFKSFNEASEDILRQHQGLWIRDEVVRESVVKALDKMVGAMYSRFVERHQNESFSKSEWRGLERRVESRRIHRLLTCARLSWPTQTRASI